MATIEPYKTADGRDAKAFAATLETSKLRGEFVSASGRSHHDRRFGADVVGATAGIWSPQVSTLPSGAGGFMSPRWADVRIANVRFTDVQAWVTEMSTTMGPSMVDSAHLALAQILDDAVKDRLLVANPARGVKKPTAAQPRHFYLTADQLNMLADESGEYRSLVLLLGIGGLRWGEATALRPCEIDFLRRRIGLHRNVVRVGGEFFVGSLKSGKNRTVVVPQFVIDALARTAEGKGREELMWTAPRAGGYLQGPSQPVTWLPRAITASADRSDVPAGDTTCPAAHRGIAGHLGGANQKVVQRMLGHASAAMTLDVYADLFECDLDAVAESVSKMCPA